MVAWIPYGKTIIWGHNSNKTSPKAKREFNQGETIYRTHAEWDALKRCPDPRGQTLYVTRMRRNGSIGLAKPCKDCQKAITLAGIKRVIYTDQDGAWQTWRPNS